MVETREAADSSHKKSKELSSGTAWIRNLPSCWLTYADFLPEYETYRLTWRDFLRLFSFWALCWFSRSILIFYFAVCPSPSESAGPTPERWDEKWRKDFSTFSFLFNLVLEALFGELVKGNLFALNGFGLTSRSMGSDSHITDCSALVRNCN